MHANAMLVRPASTRAVQEQFDALFQMQPTCKRQGRSRSLVASAFWSTSPGVADRSDNVAEKMDRLVAAVERSREGGRRHRRLDRGEELENVVKLAEELPVRRRGQLRYPVLKRLGWDRIQSEQGG